MDLTESLNLIDKVYNLLDFIVSSIPDDRFTVYSFTVETDIVPEYDYYDGYEIVSFTLDTMRLIIAPDNFVVQVSKGHELFVKENYDNISTNLFWVDTEEIDITDADSYFQYSMITELHNVPWEYFPKIKELQMKIFPWYFE